MAKKHYYAILLLGVFSSGVAVQVSAAAGSTANILNELKNTRIVDLSHEFATHIPHWYGFHQASRKTVYNYQPDGFKVEEYCHVGQWGTHVDPPGHFFAPLRMMDDIMPSEMILPLVVIDVHQAVAANPDYTLTVNDVKNWEARHGTIPAGSFVAMRTDWSKRWPDQAKMMNEDAAGTKHYPGWSLPALKYLYETRKITASGHETTDTDPGLATSRDDYSLEAYILSQNHYQIELLTHLDRVPEAGAIAVVTWSNVNNGSGFPARVLAIVNKNQVAN